MSAALFFESARRAPLNFSKQSAKNGWARAQNCALFSALFHSSLAVSPFLNPQFSVNFIVKILCFSNILNTLMHKQTSYYSKIFLSKFNIYRKERSFFQMVSASGSAFAILKSALMLCNSSTYFCLIDYHKQENRVVLVNFVFKGIKCFSVEKLRHLLNSLTYCRIFSNVL